jgi:hypothetical protein
MAASVSFFLPRVLVFMGSAMAVSIIGVSIIGVGSANSNSIGSSFTTKTSGSSCGRIAFSCCFFSTGS